MSKVPTLENTPHRRLQPSPIRLRASPRSPGKRSACSNITGQDSSRKRLFQDQLNNANPDVAYFPRLHLGFSLVKDHIAEFPTDGEMDILKEAFPHSTSIGVVAGTLIVRYGTLPPKPWPVVTAGLPVYITTSESAWPLTPQHYGGTKRIMNDLDARSGPTREAFDLVVKYFEKELDVALVSIRNILGQWVITIPDDIDPCTLPCMIASSPCSYVLCGEESEPREAAQRFKQPVGVVWDTSSYNPLRPGIMVSAGKTTGCDDELLTTCGIKVTGTDGNEFFTVASHGFPESREVVYHPTVAGEPIGDVVHRIPDSDILICKFRLGQVFENETFTGGVLDDTVEGTSVKGIRTDRIKQYDLVSMNNPFSGYHDGVYIGTELRRLPIDEMRVERKWVEISWLWLGMGIEPLNGSCGSAVLDEDGNVVSFFRFLVDQYPGCGIGIAAHLLSDFGYRVP